MRIISRKTLKDFWTKYPDSEQALKSWFKEFSNQKWRNINDIKNKYPHASIIGNNRIIFNICRNKYRLIVKINIAFQLCYVRFIGTHKEYDIIDVNKI